jgi:hypothetical protein
LFCLNDFLVSNFAFKLNLYPYAYRCTEVTHMLSDAYVFPEQYDVLLIDNLLEQGQWKVGLYTFNPVDPYVETAGFQPLNLLQSLLSNATPTTATPGGHIGEKKKRRSVRRHVNKCQVGKIAVGGIVAFRS